MGGWHPPETSLEVGGSQIKKKVNIMETTRFNRQICKELGSKVGLALNEALKDSGIQVELGRASSSDLKFAVKLIFTFADGETEANSLVI